MALNRDRLMAYVNVIIQLVGKDHVHAVGSIVFIIENV